MKRKAVLMAQNKLARHLMRCRAAWINDRSTGFPLYLRRPVFSCVKGVAGVSGWRTTTRQMNQVERIVPSQTEKHVCEGKQTCERMQSRSANQLTYAQNLTRKRGSWCVKEGVGCKTGKVGCNAMIVGCKTYEAGCVIRIVGSNAPCSEQRIRAVHD
jgi:hypothetical protein